MSNVAYWESDNVVPRVSHLTAPGASEMRDPGNEVANLINLDYTVYCG